MKLRSLALALFLAITSIAGRAADTSSPDKEGYIRNWVVLAPFSIEGSAASEEIDKKQFADEALPKAIVGDKQRIGDKELEWKKLVAKDYFIDFKDLSGTSTENVAGWAVAYIVADQEMKGLTLKMNSNDQGKVYLNGKELAKFTETRALEKEQEDAVKDVTLKKGVNVLVLKVINEINDWSGSVRFLDASGKPVTNVRVQSTP
jgi:hypothetical protein